jgi:hypothetical protein
MMIYQTSELLTEHGLKPKTYHHNFKDRSKSNIRDGNNTK